MRVDQSECEKFYSRVPPLMSSSLVTILTQDLKIQVLTFLRVVPSWCVELQRRSGASLPIKMSHTPLSRLPCYQNTDLTQDFKLNNIIKINSKRKKWNILSVSGIFQSYGFLKGFGVIFKRLEGFIKRYVTHQWTFYDTHEAEISNFS